MLSAKAAKAKFFPLPRTIGTFIVLGFLTAPSPAYEAIAPFWASTIDSALSARDRYYKAVLPDTSNFAIVTLNKMQRRETYERLAAAPDSGNPWYFLFLGILQSDQDQVASSNCFATALTMAQQDAGTTWALFVEFTRNHQAMWAERCLMHLEKLLLASGAQSAPAIAQQLLFYAYSSEKQKDDSIAFSYYRWAERFDRNQPWSLFHRLWKCLPSHLPLFIASFNDMSKLFLTSWAMQLNVAVNLYMWIRYFLIAFVLTVFAGTGLKYFPQAIHPIADRLPEEIPASLKTLLPVCMILAFLSFGVIPFLWLLFFLVWRFVEKKEKCIVAFAVIVLACAPIDARIQDMFRQARMPQCPLSLYNHASEEGYSHEIHQRALARIAANRSDVLAHITVSLCALKIGDTAAAGTSIRNALSLRPDDPVALLQAGNTAYVTKDFKTAAQYYQQILKKFPDQMAARFNLAQSYARKADTTIDLDFIKTLSAEELNYINNLTNTNEMYFSKSWPVLRQFIHPSYSPAYFWKSIFPVYNGSWDTARSLWGASFFGLAPYQSLVVFIALLILSIGWNIFLLLLKNKPQCSTCRLCERIICRNCKKGELCLSCFHTTRSIRNVKTLAAIQAKIVKRHRISLSIIEHALDIVLPGSGMLFSKKYSLTVVSLVILLTSVNYASYFFVSNVHFNCPLWAVYDGIEKMPWFFGIYNFIFAVRAVIAAFGKKEAVLA